MTAIRGTAARPSHALARHGRAGVGLRLAAALALVGAASAAVGGPVLERVRRDGVVRVCIWPEYYGVTYRNPRTDTLSGIDIDLSRELARDLAARVEYVESSFPDLIADLQGNRCDVGMFAIGMLPQRMEKLTFSRPYLQSDIYAITTRSSRVVKEWRDIDQPGVVVAVQAGTFMEPVMKAALRQARIVSVAPPRTRERELEAGRVDVFMTDYPYSRRLLEVREFILDRNAAVIDASRKRAVSIGYGFMRFALCDVG